MSCCKSEEQHRQEQEAASGRAMMVLFALPFIVITIAFSFFAWKMAKAGTKYLAVKLLAFPAAFIISTIFGSLCFLCGSFILGFFGGREVMNYAWAHWADLSLCIVWGPVFIWFAGVLGGKSMHYADVLPSIPMMHIFIYQVILYFLVTGRVARQLTIAIYDSAVHSVCHAEGIEPRVARDMLMQNDAGYQNDAEYYGKKPALVPMLAVMFSGGNIQTYYLD